MDTDLFPDMPTLQDPAVWQPVEGDSDILTPDAIRFLVALHEQFNRRRLELLLARETRQQRLDEGEKPGFLPETASVREGDWTVSSLPGDLLDRRVEITGPAERKMIINALNSGASVFMADLEDSLSPTWANVVQGQIHLRDAVRGTIAFDDPQSGKAYRLNPKTAVLLVRPRGWHLEETHLRYHELPLSGSLVDFGLYFFHNVQALLDKGTGPYFYLPKLESHLEARLWNDVFVFAQDYLGIPRGIIKATVLIETVLASFELDEILWELREHAAGLNCGRWDYIFSFIKKFRRDPDCVLPDRAQVTMTAPFMRAYARRVIQVCHRRGALAIGGMAAQIPIKNDPEANEAALEKVRQDKLREVQDGHDGTWVAHPGLVPIALDIFNAHMPAPNQLERTLPEWHIAAADLLEVPKGEVTETGVRLNINVGLLYVESWLRGTGCAALYNLMEDAATAEISRSQLWQWRRHGVRLADGRVFDDTLYDLWKKEELEKIRGYVGASNFDQGRFAEAETLFDQLVRADEFTEFLTLPAYKLI